MDWLRFVVAAYSVFILFGLIGSVALFGQPRRAGDKYGFGPIIMLGAVFTVLLLVWQRLGQ